MKKKTILICPSFSLELISSPAWQAFSATPLLFFRSHIQFLLLLLPFLQIQLLLHQLIENSYKILQTTIKIVHK